jgi:polyisoprenoid-binding protein YceI
MKKMHFLQAAAVAVLMASCGQQPSAPSANKPGESVSSAPEADVKLIVPASEYALDKTHALLEFSISHMGLSNYTPRFGDFDASIVLDPENIDKSTVTMTVNPASISTLYPADYKSTHANLPYKTWDEQLAYDPGFFDARKFATATFKSTKVEKSGPRNAKVTGDFTFLGVTKPVTFDVALVGQVEKHMMSKLPAFGVRAEGKILPSDFGMKGPMSGNPVSIVFDGEFQQKVPAGAPAADATAPTKG